MKIHAHRHHDIFRWGDLIPQNINLPQYRPCYRFLAWDFSVRFGS